MPLESSQIVEELYEKAKIRALERFTNNTEMVAESHGAFLDGLRFVHSMGGEFDLLTSPENLFPRVVSESNEGFAIVCAFLAKVEAVKGKGYLANWQENGLRSALDNLRRKFGRIKTIIENNSDGGGESLSENVADLAVYSIKTLAYLNELNPEEVLRWAQGIRNLK